MTSASATPQLFSKISSLLTGFSETELKATGMLDTYYDTILANNSGDNIDFFFQNVSAILNAPKQTDDDIEEGIRTQLMPDISYNALAKNIIMLWYTGNLYDMAGPNPGFTSNVVNAESYKQGLMWTAAHSHPPGAKQPGYGSWANPPITLK